MSSYVHSKTYQKVISMFLIVCFLITPTTFLTLPKKVEASCTPFGAPTAPDPFSVPVHDSATSVTKQADQQQKNSNWFKNCIMDGLATLIAKTIIKQLTRSIVMWINSGFQGNPSFLENPQGFFLGVADRVGGAMIERIAPFLCSPFRLNIQLALALSISGPGDDISCTLTQVEQNIIGAVNTSSVGFSWDSWYNMTQNPQNNPYGAMMVAQEKMMLSIDTAQGKYQQQLDWGRGFLSFEECPAQNESGVQENQVAEYNQDQDAAFEAARKQQSYETTSSKSYAVETQASLASIGSLGLLDSIFGENTNEKAIAAVQTSAKDSQTGQNTAVINTNTSNGGGEVIRNSKGNVISDTNVHTNKNNPNDRQVYDANNQPVYGVQAGNNGCVTKTPGAVIESQLNTTLGSDLRGLEIAQSIDQIVAALAGQLMKAAMGGVGGLLGAGGSSYSDNSGSSFNYQTSLAAGGVNDNTNASSQIPELPITGSCMPNKQNAQLGEVVRWDVYVPDINGSVTYTWYGDENLTSHRASATTTYSSNGYKVASVIVKTKGSKSKSVQIDCTPGVQIGSNSIVQTPTISCAGYPNSAQVNSPVTWQAIVTGGYPPFVYSWQGTDGLNATGESTIKSYTSTGTKEAVLNITGTDGNTYSKVCTSLNVTQ